MDTRDSDVPNTTKAMLEECAVLLPPSQQPSHRHSTPTISVEPVFSFLSFFFFYSPVYFVDDEKNIKPDLVTEGV
ncbi:Hypothetical protein NTJ_04104 [Nesidiocoris tenuis]|uniref:Uncharacterized protein n=1 Tax=Nesidiocoris tenuis TaxID=355587 RepID=A0ABN7AGA3_9HEMI|nr:Hypothetical protein NTJ_04104 [Nesidiocoris tenuis]